MIVQNNKKYVYLTTALVVIIAAIAVYCLKISPAQSTSADLSNPTKIIKVDKDAKIYNTADELEKDADLVVQVKATDQSEHINKEEDGGIPLWYWTETEVEVSKVLSAKSDSVKQGDYITIYEPYSVFVDKANIVTMINSNSYEKLTNQKRYILFLKKHEDGGYMPLGVQQGKINLDEPDKDNMKLSQSVKDKYVKNK